MDVVGEAVSLVVGLAMLALVVVAYFLPSIVAVRQKAPYQGAAVLVNFFFGLTLIGWVIALVLALAKRPPAVRVESARLVPATVEGWYPDPFGRYEFRFFDGLSWTQHVGTSGVQGEDPVAL